MYECKCGRKIDLTNEQWHEIEMNYTVPQNKSSKCECGEILHVCTSPELFEDHWFVSDLYFESEL